ncbi:MAG TPA: EAL domain-containing protein [Thermoanaerobaculia bacterium]|nr:EAL domain-containing protein [Thermoanaerobaculia bacterium]
MTTNSALPAYEPSLSITPPPIHAAPGVRQVVLVLDDDPIVTEGLSLGLEEQGRTVITCNDLESAQIIVETLKPSHIVADVRLTGAFGYEGLDFIGYAKRHSPSSRVILMTGDAPEALQLEASHRGAVAFLQKPFGGRQLGAVIKVMSGGTTTGTGEPVTVRIPILDDILISPDLYPVFQPIVRLGPTWQTFGYESLARYRSDSPMQHPSVLFDYANRKHRVDELEFECVRRALASAATGLTESTLFMNIHPTVLSSSGGLLQILGQLEPQLLERLVLEITEHAELPGTFDMFRAIDEIRALGVRFAFDDFGGAHTHLSVIHRVQPSFLKIGQEFGTAFETDPSKEKIIKNIVSIGHDFGCELILEGIEDVSTAEAAAHLGIGLGQGYLFGYPAELTGLPNTLTAREKTGPRSEGWLH